MSRAVSISVVHRIRIAERAVQFRHGPQLLKLLSHIFQVPVDNDVGFDLECGGYFWNNFFAWQSFAVFD